MKAPAGPGRGRYWWPGIAGATLLGLGIRLASVLGRPHRVPGGDPLSYHYGANLLAAGLGFINPWLYYGHNLHLHQPSAAYPPLFTVLISLSSLVGFKSFFAHRIWACVIGSAAIPVAGCLGRELMGGRTGRRVGLLGALIVAVYPNIWMSNEQLMSETISPTLAGLILLAAYRFWRRPGGRGALALGAVIGLATLGRDEMALLTLLVVPLALLARSLPWPSRLGRVGLAAAGFVIVVGPWIGYNLSRFDKPVLISTGLGNTLASADCATTFGGPKSGYWSLACALAAPHDPYQDASVTAAQAQTYAMRYVRAHERELPRVVFARVGRTFGFYQPNLQLRDDEIVETRPFHWAEVGLYSYYGLVLLSIPALFVLRRRRVPLYPLLAIGLDVAVSVAITLGQTRYRSAFEMCLAVTGAIGADAVIRTLWAHRRRHRAKAGPDRQAVTATEDYRARAPRADTASMIQASPPRQGINLAPPDADPAQGVTTPEERPAAPVA